MRRFERADARLDEKESTEQRIKLPFTSTALGYVNRYFREMKAEGAGGSVHVAGAPWPGKERLEESIVAAQRRQSRDYLSLLLVSVE